MATAVQPVSIDGIEFDALITASETFEATVPDYAVETGFSVTDSIILSPETLSMTLLISNLPVTWAGRFGTGNDRVGTIIQQMKDLYFNKEPVTVSTSEMTYTDMALISFGTSKTKELGYAREITVTFKKIRTTTAETTTIPDSYGKSGTTGTSAGTASTAVVSTGTSGTSSTSSYSSTSSSASSSSSTSTSSSSSSSSSGKSSSILYNLASGSGLL